MTINWTDLKIHLRAKHDMKNDEKTLATASWTNDLLKEVHSQRLSVSTASWPF